MARRKARPASPPPRLILDSGAVIALGRGDARARAFLRRSLELGAEVLIPSVVIAETTRRNPRDARVNRVIRTVDSVVPIDEELARVAGGLLGMTGLTQTIDALVIAVAAWEGGRVLTSDPGDLARLASHVEGVSIHPV